jgi:hypothetical protein
MDSHRTSNASTFVTPSGDDSHDRLLQEFSIDDKDTNKISSHHLPLLYTPAYASTYALISKARIAILALSVPKFIIPLFGAPDTLLPFFPIAFISLFLTMFGMLGVFGEDLAYKNARNRDMEGGGGRDKVAPSAGDKRTAILVEDPVTGEEKWMFERKNKDSGAVVPDYRKLRAGVDLWCGSVFGLTMFFAVYWGLDSPITLGLMMTVMVVQL